MTASRWLRALLVALVAGSGVALAGPGSAAAATSVATEAELRGALANPATTGVVLANDIDLTDCTPSGGDLDRAGAITVDGGGFTINQTCPGERVLESTSGTLTLQHVTITGGDQTGTGIVLGGGVLSAEDLVLDDTTVTGNTVTGEGSPGSAGALGGGVESDGTITLVASHVDGNTASSTAGSYGAGVLGGAGHDITITDSTVDRNIAETTDTAAQNAGADGGGVALVAHHDGTSPILDPAGTVRIVRSSVSENVAHPVATDVALAVGGGVFADTTELEASHVDANELHPTATDDAAVGWGGGALTGSSFTAVASTLDGNVVDPDGVVEVADFGAAMSQHVLTLTGSSATDNQVVAAGPSGFAECAGLAAETVTANSSVVDGNQVSGTAVAIGGGVCSGTATIAASTISGNTVTSANGEASGGGGVIGGGTFRASTVSANSVEGTTAHGGGLVHRGGFSSDAVGELLEITNSTVAGNTASGTTSSSAGGIEQLHDPTLGNAGPLAVVFSTFAANSAGAGANLGNSGDTDPITSYASTISAPLGGGTNCGAVTLVDQGYTQITDASCGTVASADPQLGALADNGGVTATMLPAATSPLLDRVPIDACTVRVTTDQRGITRPQGSGCDIGAIEIAVTPVGPPVTPPEAPATAPPGPSTAPAIVATPRFTG